MEEPIIIASQILAITLVLTVHEFAHAYTAYKFGDPTAKLAGRMTLNPLKHFDAIGLVAFILTRFGWAKPVPINPYNFKDKKKGYLWTSAAGILVNYTTAILVYPIFSYIGKNVEYTYVTLFFYMFFFYMYHCSLSFSVFNLLPLYPLDGFRIVESVDQKHKKIQTFLKKYSSYILIGLILIHYLSDKLSFLMYIDLLGFALNHIIHLLAMPIEWFWSIFNL